MSTMLPYLVFCGSEVSNSARVGSYLVAGLSGTDRFYVDMAAMPPILFQDADGSPVTYVDPATDAAPWYDASMPQSGNFLGFLCDRITGMDSTETRTSQATSTYRGGSVLSPPQLQEREIKLHGWLVASECDALEYGRRWLGETLGSASCADCDLYVRLAEPPDDGSDDQRGAWTLYRVGLRDIVVTDPYQCCDLREVNITLVAGDPVLYKPPAICTGPAQLAPSATVGGPCMPFDQWFCGDPIDPPICCPVQPPVIGTMAAIVRIDAYEAFGGARITIDVDCPTASGDPAEAELSTGPMPAGTSLVVDAARHRVTYIDPNGVGWDGVPYLALPAGKSVPWLEISKDDPPSCVCVEPLAPCAGGADTYVTILTQSWVK